jgi:hypothetical protein
MAVDGKRADLRATLHAAEQAEGLQPCVCRAHSDCSGERPTLPSSRSLSSRWRRRAAHDVPSGTRSTFGRWPSYQRSTSGHGLHETGWAQANPRREVDLGPSEEVSLLRALGARVVAGRTAAARGFEFILAEHVDRQRRIVNEL